MAAETRIVSRGTCSAASDALPVPESLPSENPAPKPSDHTTSSSMTRGSFIMHFRRLIPILKGVAAAIAVLVIWSLVAPFAAEIATWIGSNIVALGVAILAIAIAGYLLVIYSQVYEGLPQDVLTLRADVMCQLDTMGASAHISSSSSEQTSGMSIASQGKATVQSQEYTTIIQEEFELWMQPEQFTLLP